MWVQVTSIQIIHDHLKWMFKVLKVHYVTLIQCSLASIYVSHHRKLFVCLGQQNISTSFPLWLRVFKRVNLKLTNHYPDVGQTVITSEREAVKVGDHVTLTCNTTCTLSSSPSFIWSKDGRPVEKKQRINNQLQLHPVRYEDGGSYTCAVKGHEDLPSPAMILNVQCEFSSKTTDIYFSKLT